MKLDINDDLIHSHFRRELDLIKNPSMKQFTVEALKRAPYYFFTDCPASSSGKYHTPDENGPLGTILHSRRVANVSMEIAKAMGIVTYTDEMVCAALLHDSFKYGENRGPHTVKNHPEIAADMVVDFIKGSAYNEVLTKEQKLVIWGCIMYHMGQWGQGKSKKPLGKFTDHEMCMHLADVVASRNNITINV